MRSSNSLKRSGCRRSARGSHRGDPGEGSTQEEGEAAYKQEEEVKEEEDDGGIKEEADSKPAHFANGDAASFEEPSRSAELTTDCLLLALIEEMAT